MCITKDELKWTTCNQVGNTDSIPNCGWHLLSSPPASQDCCFASASSNTGPGELDNVEEGKGSLLGASLGIMSYTMSCNVQ